MYRQLIFVSPQIPALAEMNLRHLLRKKKIMSYVICYSLIERCAKPAADEMMTSPVKLSADCLSSCQNLCGTKVDMYRIMAGHEKVST